MTLRNKLFLLYFALLCLVCTGLHADSGDNNVNYNYSMFRFKSYYMSGGFSLGYADNPDIGASFKFNFAEIPCWSLKADISAMPLNGMQFFVETGAVCNFYFEKAPNFSMHVGPCMGVLLKNLSSYFGFGLEVGLDCYINEAKNTSLFLDLSDLTSLFPTASAGIRFYY